MQVGGTSKSIMKKYGVLIFFSLGIAIISLRINIVSGDDVWFRDMLQRMSIIDWMQHRFIHNVPRYFSDFCVALVGYRKPLWIILNSAMGLVYGYFLIKNTDTVMADPAVTTQKYATLLSCFFLLYPYVITSSVMWMTGSYFYFWPNAMFLVAIYPFISLVLYQKPLALRFTTVLYIIASIFASYTEQTAAVLLCMATFCLIVTRFMSRQKPSLFNYIQYIVIVLNVAMFFIRNIRQDRISTELSWYPDFAMLSLYDKIFQSINLTHFHIINSTNLVFFLVVTAVFFVHMKKSNKLLKVAASVPFLFMLLNILPFDTILSVVNKNNDNVRSYDQPFSSYRIGETLFQSVFDSTRSNPSNLSLDIMDLFPSFVCMFILLLVAVLLVAAFKNLCQGLLASCIFIAALVSGYVLGLSPTIFASGSRIYFMSDTLLLLLTGLLLGEPHMQQLLFRSKRSKIINAVIVFSALLMIAQFFFSYSQGILYL